ncbi:MAG: tRNA (guanine(10)-N(2))-dimethyltransferase [Candidatus Micrarchaeia archaeon]
MELYREGKAEIINNGKAFLNKEAKFSRDISIAFAKSFKKPLTSVLDPTAATGIRGIRYMLEAGIEDAIFLDINKSAYEALIENIKNNRLQATATNISIQEFANTTSKKFELIDLDPFGSPAPYIYDLLKVVKDNTYMMITATDTAVLCGAHPNACLRIYDSKPIHSNMCHEVGLRILAGYVARVAAQFNYGTSILLAFSHKHYMRIFTRFNHGAANASKTLSMLGYMFQCSKCGYVSHSNKAFPELFKCPICGNKLDIGGKLWIGNLYNVDTVKGIIKNLESNSEAARLIESIIEEVDIPGFFYIPKITGLMKIGAISHFKLIDCLRKKGFKASQTHLKESSIKTDAGILDIRDCVSTINLEKS